MLREQIPMDFYGDIYKAKTSRRRLHDVEEGPRDSGDKNDDGSSIVVLVDQSIRSSPGIQVSLLSALMLWCLITANMASFYQLEGELLRLGLRSSPIARAY
jgi:hypothetical protein